MEIWKQIPNSKYEASSFGRVRNPQGRVLKLCNHALGYLIVSVKIDGVSKTRTVHSLVCMAFHGPRPAGLDIAHRDCNKHNNTPENLRYCTRSENLMDSVSQPRFGFERYPWRLMDIGETFEVGSNYPRKNIAWRSRERGRKFDREFSLGANDDGSWTVTRVA